MKYYTEKDPQPDIERVGGKALNLWKLSNLGMRVPGWLVFDRLELTGLLGTADNDVDAKITEAVNAVFDHEDRLYAVRSSGVQEDGQAHSFAGLFETRLYVKAEELAETVRAVGQSSFSERVEVYRTENGLGACSGIGIIVQEMVDPEVSGVAFGVDPTTGIRGSAMICSVFGVGEGLVSGALNADTFRFDGTDWQTSHVQKTHALVRAENGGVKMQELPAEQQMATSLNPAQLAEVHTTLRTLEAQLGHPQDIEFAFRDGVFYLLQTRPVTAVHNRAAQHNRIVWDNSNIVESYPGVTTPLTFSYILDAYRKVYIQLALLMGASRKTVIRNEATFANMLGLINGRVYYNLLSWYKVLSLFPGYALNARFMETMMGVKERFDVPQAHGSRISAFFRTGIMIGRIAWNRLTIRRQSRKFMQEVEKELQQIRRLQPDNMSSFELMEVWLGLDKRLTARWKAPLVNDSFAMLYFGRLQQFVRKQVGDKHPNLHNDLLCGSRDIISVEPVHRSLDLSAEIMNSGELKDLFETHTAAQVWNALQEERYAAFYGKILAYLDDFGERCVGELKLETVSFRQQPSLFVETLQSFVRNGVTKEKMHNSLDIRLREDAEAIMKDMLKGKPLKQLKFRRLLRKARYFVSNRENLRYERTRVFGVTRELFTAIGKVWERDGIVDEYDDIFYLTKQEIFAFIRGTAVDTQLKWLTAMRREEYALYAEKEMPAERFTTYDAVHIGNDFFAEMEAQVNGDLQGQGCCPGRVKGRVRIVKHPKDVESLEGDILVTSSTDPGWVTLFPTAGAIIVERGSLLSHSAIVSREMGIPCIVGVTGLLSTLRDGELIEMDGSTGCITRLENE